MIINKLNLSTQVKNKLIFFSVSFFAAQSLFFMHIYKINVPYTVDWVSMTYLYDYLISGNFPFKELLSNYNAHVMFFPKLLALPNLLLNKFDVGNFFYVQWIVLALTLFITFLIIRRKQKKLYWILIPISAFIFSPLSNSNYYSHIILIWYIPALCITSIIYVLDKKLDLKIITLTIFLSIVATFSTVIGVIAWIVAGSNLLKLSIKKNSFEKKWLLIWFASMTITGIVYYSTFISVQQISSSELFSYKGIPFIATFLTVPFKLKYNILIMIAGIASILLSIILVWYLVFIKRKLDEVFPWILFLIVGLSGAIITRLGRSGDYYKGDLPYYIPISNFFQIGICVLVGYLILEINQKEILKSKKIILILLYSIIISQMILLIPSYYFGWWRGDYYFQEKYDILVCYSLYHGNNCTEHYILDLDKSNTSYKDFQMLNYFLKNKLSFFSDANYNKETLEELKIFENTYSKKENLTIINGKITTINNLDVNESSDFKINDDVLIISGWMLVDDIKSVDVMYLMANDKPIMKYDDFKYSPTLENTNDLTTSDKSYWNFSLLNGYLPDGCKEITVAGMKDNSPFILNDSIEICENH